MTEVTDTVSHAAEGLSQRDPLHTRCIPHPLLGGTSPEEPRAGITKSAPAESFSGCRVLSR